MAAENPSSNPSARPRPVEVAVAVVWRRSDRGAELLIARRHDGAIRGGLWEFPGGKIDAGETAARAALREVEEEVGLGAAAICGEPQALLMVEHSDPELLREKTIRLHAFLLEVRADAQARALGSREVRWIDVDQLDGFEWPKANHAINLAVRSRFRRT